MPGGKASIGRGLLGNDGSIERPGQAGPQLVDLFGCERDTLYTYFDTVQDKDCTLEGFLVLPKQRIGTLIGIVAIPAFARTTIKSVR